MSLITSKEGLRSSQVDLQSARKGLKSAVRASKPAEGPRGRDRQTDRWTDGEEKKNDGKNCPWFYRSSSPTGSLSKNHVLKQRENLQEVSCHVRTTQIGQKLGVGHVNVVICCRNVTHSNLKVQMCHLNSVTILHVTQKTFCMP